ncbi:protein takeout-like [Sitodiplosis mosellana]|uniref:protein takeout-like n=1 Tax=Sitodiplosis mosellana TaxID=263140 RepID=UPI002443EA7B|nr:protein takeout-like [Sitodiplosis mosellana]
MLKLIFVLALSISCCWCSKFQSSKIPQCAIGDTNCIKETTNLVLSQFYGGEPKVALAKMDPLQIQRMQIKQGGNSPVNIDLSFNNVELHGLKDFHCTYVKGFGPDPNGQYEMRAKGPLFILKGPYTINGRILVLPIQGNGISNFTLENPELHIKWTGKSKVKNGKTHLYTDDLRMTFKITRMQAYFGNLFNGNPELGESTNRFMNENWQDIFNEIKGSIFDAFSLIMQTMMNNMWAHHDYKEMFKQ